MRVGILTFHRSINYGAFMQSYALSNEIKKRYPHLDVEIIDFEYKFKHDSYERGRHGLLNIVAGYRTRYDAFQRDLHRLPLSPDSFITNKTDDLFKYIDNRYDIVISGSDAVFAFQGKMPVENPYFLGADKLRNVVKMSYAASAFTVNFELVTNDERDYLSDCLSSFSYIGVRDNATKGFLESLARGKEVYLNHDPTIFLEPANNRKMASEVLRHNRVWKEKKCISFMSRSFPFMEDVEKLLGKDYQIIEFYNYNSLKQDFFNPNRHFISDLSPWQWYNMYSRISINVSYYFHGALLGIINHVPTLAIDDFDGTYDSKYKQVMADLGLTDFLFQSKTLDKEMFLSKLEYLSQHREEVIKVQEIGIKEERRKSASFFKALESFI